MSIPFFTEEWISAYKAAINGNPAYKTAAAEWTHGVVALVCKAQPPAFPVTSGSGSTWTGACAGRRSS